MARIETQYVKDEKKTTYIVSYVGGLCSVCNTFVICMLYSTVYEINTTSASLLKETHDLIAVARHDSKAKKIV